MRVIDPGHRYELYKLDVPEWRQDKTASLVFVKREGDKYPGNVGIHPGVTTQEVLRACADRLIYVNAQIPDANTMRALACVYYAIHALEVRAALRAGRPNQMTIATAVNGATCLKCGHVGCEGGCHGKLSSS